MGLDMYLTATAHVHDEHGVEIEGLDAVGLEISGIKYDAGYWRKANAIHGWFVNRVQGGVDDCKPYVLERSQLKELRDLCAYILKDRDPADLPPTAGFFFGSQEVDQYYWEDLELTVGICDRCLDLKDSSQHIWSFEYQSSW